MLAIDLIETKLNPINPRDDYHAKMKSLYDLERDKNVDQQAVQQRMFDLKKEYNRLELDEGKIKDWFKKSALATALVSALMGSPAQADPMTDNPMKEPVPQTQQQEKEAVKNAIIIFNTITNIKNLSKEGLESEARDEIMKLIRGIRRHPNQQQITPIVKDIIKTEKL